MAATTIPFGWVRTDSLDAFYAPAVVAGVILGAFVLTVAVTMITAVPTMPRRLRAVRQPL